MVTSGYWNPDGTPTQSVIDLYAERAAGGLGLVQVEATGILPPSATALGGRSTGKGIVTPEQVEGHRRLAEVIHAGGAKATLQLFHGGRQSVTEDAILNPTRENAPVAPSDSTPAWRGVRPRGLNIEEIDQILDAYATAAVRAQDAGYDGVLFHGAHGFLPMQFLSPYTNVGRDDKYGQDRTTFAVEMIQRTREAVGPEMALMFRISGNEGLGDRGLTPTLIAREIAPRLEDAGIDAIDVSGGQFEKFYWVGQPIYFPRAVMMPWAEEIQQSVSIPVVGVGRVNDPRLVDSILERDRVALVALGRALMADPEFPNKMLDGRYDEIVKCIACGACPWETPPPGGALGCAVNPYLGRPQVRAQASAPAPVSKRVVVIGGGVAGMAAAETAALRGHDVTLIERDEALGGTVNVVASGIPRVYTRELAQAVPNLVSRVSKAGVDVQLSTEATPQTVGAMEPDAVILATGSEPELPDIPGIDRELVVTEEDYIEQRLKLGHRVAVLGGPMGAEVALALARDDKQVVLLSEGDEESIGATPYIAGRRWRLQRLIEMLHDEPNLRIRTGVRVKAIIDNAVVFNIRDNQWEETLEVDNVVLAWGRKPHNELSAALSDVVDEVHVVGDCKEPRSMYQAIHEGTHVAMTIGEEEAR